MRVWCQHARQFLGQRRYLHEPVCISYNAWASSAGYRGDVAEGLGLRFDDDAAHRVPSCAGGSSFDGVRHDGSPADMALFERWRRYADDDDYRRLFTPEVHRLASAMLGDVDAALAASLRRSA